jgi:hypothetical protein
VAWALVPEAAIDEYCKAMPYQREVRGAALGKSLLNGVAQAKGMYRLPEQKLGLGVAVGSTS